jgi:hypothetical protein
MGLANRGSSAAAGRRTLTEQNATSPFDNHDLKAEAPEARDESVRFAFEFPELLAKFRADDAKANRAKRNNRRLGYASVFLVLAALFIASSAPAQHELHFSKGTTVALGYVAAALGLLGSLLAFAGMHGRSPRRVWLQNRLNTELLRLFHFRFIASRLPEITRIKGDEARKQAYLAERAAAFARLAEGPLADPAAELKRITEGKGAYDFSNMTESRLEGGEDPAVAEKVFAAWRVLRLDWQLSYTNEMLAHRPRAQRMSILQTERAFARFAWFCVGMIILLHVVQVFGEQLHVPHAWLEVAVVWTALAALGARALEDGLQPQREVERYEQYRAGIKVAKDRLGAGDGLSGDLEIVRTFERTGLEEMWIFMRTHYRSRFML